MRIAVLPVERPPITRTLNSPAGFSWSPLDRCLRRSTSRGDGLGLRFPEPPSVESSSSQLKIALRYLASSGVKTRELVVIIMRELLPLLVKSCFQSRSGVSGMDVLYMQI